MLNTSVISKDGKDASRHIGGRSLRQRHALNLRSAYETYSSAGEPIFTVCIPEKPSKKEKRLKHEKDLREHNRKPTKSDFCREVCCMDYIFCSCASFQVWKASTRESINEYLRLLSEPIPASLSFARTYIHIHTHTYIHTHIYIHTYRQT